LRRVRSLLTATLRVSAIIEVATGCALLTVPSDIIQALVGSRSDQAGWIVGRVLGGALLALGVAAMFPPGQSPEGGVALGFAIYNASTTVILGVAGVAGAADGWLLWPVVGIHGILTVALIVLTFRGRRTS
jgi:hypothetical protein